MKKLIVTFLALAGVIFQGFAALTALHIRTVTHGVVTLLLEDEPALTFNDDRTITVEVANNPEYKPVTIAFDDVEACEYGNPNDYDGSSVVAVGNDVVPSIMVSFNSEGVKFSNITPDGPVEIYSVSGGKVMQAPVADGEFTLLRGSLPAGNYIVRIGAFVSKISF